MMIGSKKHKISNKVLMRIEEKITKKVMENIDKVIAQKCKSIFEEGFSNNSKTPDKEILSISEEILRLKNSILCLHEECKSLSDSNDHILGSIAYIASEYDDFHKKISDSNKLVMDIAKLNASLDHITTRQESTELQLDRLDQYGRRENLEFHGIPVTENENTNDNVKKIAFLLDIHLDDRQISISHRLQAFQNSNTSRPIQSKAVNVTHPPIIARFANRDIRNSFFTKKRLLKDCSS